MRISQAPSFFGFGLPISSMCRLRLPKGLGAAARPVWKSEQPREVVLTYPG
jgi:hypothetical protein